MADEEVIPTERPEDPESAEAAREEMEGLEQSLKDAVAEAPVCPKKEKGEELTPELARELMAAREQAFAAYIQKGKELFHCDLKAKLEIIGNGFSTEVLVMAQPILIQKGPKASGEPIPPEPRRRRRRRSEK